MKLVVVFAAVLVCALAAPVDDKDAQTVEQTDEINPEGAFSSHLRTTNDIVIDREGVLKEGVDVDNKPFKFVVQRGQYSYVDREGKSHVVTYIADENGFQPQSDDIPKVN